MQSIFRKSLALSAITFTSSVYARQRTIEDDSACQRRGRNFGSQGRTFNEYQHYNIIASYVPGDDILKEAEALRAEQNDILGTRLDLQLYNRWTDEYTVDDNDENDIEFRELHGNLILVTNDLDIGDQLTFGVAYQEYQLENGTSRIGYDGFKIDFVFGGPTLGFPAEPVFNDDI